MCPLNPKVNLFTLQLNISDLLLLLGSPIQHLSANRGSTAPGRHGVIYESHKVSAKTEI